MGINLNPSSHSNYSTVPNLSLASITLDFFTEKAKRETEKDRQASEEREVQRIREVMYEEKRRKNRRFITECGHAFTFAEKNDHFVRRGFFSFIFLDGTDVFD